MRADVYWVGIAGGGRVGIAPRPRGGDWLDDEAKALREAGVDAIVSLLTPAEVDEFDLREEGPACCRQALAFYSFPIPDRGVPQSREDATTLARDLADEVRRGRSVAVHCRQGIGRSALMAALILSWTGTESEQALLDIEAARGRPVPDTQEQRDWIFAMDGDPKDVG